MSSRAREFKAAEASFRNTGADPWVMAAVSIWFVLIAVFASWVPARRPTQVNPVTALRSE